MNRTLSAAQTWGSPAIGAIFAVMWWLAELSRIPENVSMWEGLWPLVTVTLAIAVSTSLPVVSLTLTALLLGTQVLHLTAPLGPNTWSIYVGVFISLGFILWTGSRLLRLTSIIASAAFAAIMAFLMISRQYGGGVGWFRVENATFWEMAGTWLRCFGLLLAIAAGFASMGYLTATYSERKRLQRESEAARGLLRQAELDLVLEQERSRVSRDLHDVLSHSLAVITAQADGARYQHKDLPPETVQALATIGQCARQAMTEAQSVVRLSREEVDLEPIHQLRDLEALLQSSGLTVDTNETGIRCNLGEIQQLTAYRVIQESLTNVLKHGTGDPIGLNFIWDGSGVQISMTSTIRPQSTMVLQQPGGKGIPGMQERAALAGGIFSATSDTKNFVVTLWLPALDPISDETSKSGRQLVKRPETSTHG